MKSFSYLFRKLISFISLLLFFILFLSIPVKANASDATSKMYYVSVDRAPRIVFYRVYKDYFKIKIEENSEIKDVKIEVSDEALGFEDDKYETILEIKNREIITNNEKITVTNKKEDVDKFKEIKIKKDLFEKNKTKYFRMTISDNDKKSNRLITTFNLTLLEKSKKIKELNNRAVYFDFNKAPKLAYITKEFKTENDAKNKLSFTVEDSDKLKSLKILDLNNEIVENTNADTDNKDITYKEVTDIKLTNLIEKDGKYHIRIIAIDQANPERTYDEEVYFTLKSKEKTETKSSTNTTKTNTTKTNTTKNTTKTNTTKNTAKTTKKSSTNNAELEAARNKALKEAKKYAKEAEAQYDGIVTMERGYAVTISEIEKDIKKTEKSVNSAKKKTTSSTKYLLNQATSNLNRAKGIYKNMTNPVSKARDLYNSVNNQVVHIKEAKSTSKIDEYLKYAKNTLKTLKSKVQSYRNINFTAAKNNAKNANKKARQYANSILYTKSDY